MMAYQPVLVEAPSIMAVSLEEVKRALRIDHDDDDLELEALIQASVAHYDGWTGILGICLVEQEWRQDFDHRDDCRLVLPLGPVIAITSITWRNSAGQISTVNDDDYRLETDGTGRSYVRWLSGFSVPGDFYAHGAVSVTYRAGWPLKAGEIEGEMVSAVPADLQAAIKLRVQASYDEAARDNSANLERIERDLVSKYHRWSI